MSTTDTNIKPRDITRQCEFLILKGKELLTFNLLMQLSLRQRQMIYFETLSEYCRLYNEMKNYFLTNKIPDELINEKINNLPEIKFIDFGFLDTNFKSNVSFFFFAFLFPVSFFWSLKKYNYMKQTRQKIIIATDIFSSVDFLFKTHFR